MDLGGFPPQRHPQRRVEAGPGRHAGAGAAGSGLRRRRRRRAGMGHPSRRRRAAPAPPRPAAGAGEALSPAGRGSRRGSARAARRLLASGPGPEESAPRAGCPPLPARPRAAAEAPALLGGQRGPRSPGRLPGSSACGRGSDRLLGAAYGNNGAPLARGCAGLCGPARFVGRKEAAGGSPVPYCLTSQPAICLRAECYFSGTQRLAAGLTQNERVGLLFS